MSTPLPQGPACPKCQRPREPGRLAPVPGGYAGAGLAWVWDDPAKRAVVLPTMDETWGVSRGLYQAFARRGLPGVICTTCHRLELEY